VKKLKIGEGKIVEIVFALLQVIKLVKSFDGPRNLVTLLSHNSMRITVKAYQ